MDLFEDTKIFPALTASSFFQVEITPPDALSYAHLCEGRIDVVIQCLNQVWDIHPIIPIVKASGGVISTWKNEDAVKAGNIILSSNNTIHGKMLKLLKPALK